MKTKTSSVANYRMDWKYYIPHVWEEEYSRWEDIWMKPEGGEIAGNMGKFINLTIDTIGSVEYDCEDREEIGLLVDYLRTQESDYLVGPYPFVKDWDDVSMIVRKEKITRAEVIEYAKIYLQIKGYSVRSFNEMSEREAFADVDGE